MGGITTDPDRQLVLDATKRALLDEFPDALVIVTPTGVVGAWSRGAEQLFGYTAAEAEGASVFDLVVPRERRTADTQRLRDAILDGATSFETVRVRKDKTEIHVAISMRAIANRRGDVTHVAVCVKDISHVASVHGDAAVRAQLETALVASNKELDAFAFAVARDLSAPLRAMGGFAQALLEDYGAGLPDDALDCLHEIRNSSRRMNELITALLSLLRTSRSAMVIERVDLGALARDAAAHAAEATPERRVALQIASGLWVSGDAQLLRTLMAVLIDNAWKFTGGRADAAIEIGAALHLGVATYFVRDNGIGFDPAHAGRLFAPFERLHERDAFPGVGIGLATAQRIVHRHGGRIWAEAAPKLGATIYFTLGVSATRRT